MWRWWSWMTVVMVVGMLTSPTSVGSEGVDIGSDIEDISSLILERNVLEILTPLLGDLNQALQGFIDIGKIGMGVAKLINIFADQLDQPHSRRARRQVELPEEISSEDRIAGVVVSILHKIFNVSLEEMNYGSYVPLADRKILAMFQLLSNRLDNMEHGIHGIANSLRGLADGMQDMVRWEIALDTMEEYIRPINALYKRFLLYQQLKDKVEDHTLIDFVNSVVSHDPDSVMSLMAHLHSMAAPEAAQRATALLHSQSQTYEVLNDPKDVYRVSDRVTRKMVLQEKRMKENTKSQQLSLRPSIFRMLQDTLKSSDRCHLQQSPQQLIHGLHVILALTEARGFAMLEFAYMLLRVYNEGNFTIEQELSERLYLQYSEDIMQEAKKVLLQESTEFYRCDPKQHVQGETYVQITELLQGYIENEADMNPSGSCTQSCSYYQHAKSERCYMPSRQYCGQHRRCQGTVHDCRFHDADAWVCLSRNPYRRYDSVRYESGEILGSHGTCEGSEMKVDSWWRWFVHCSYCMCLCDDGDSPNTDRFISLVPALSHTRSNKVVTGVKFVKHRRVIHVQVQQGQALPQGQVNSSTIEWVDVEPISIISTAYTEGTHYKKLSFEDRSIDLDRLEAPDEHVITGVRFRILGSHLNLEVQITPVNFTSGKLEPYKSYWISNDNTPAMANNPRQEQKLYRPGDPTKKALPAQIDSVPDTFMRFGPTDRWKDVSQLTVPFFDAQTVAPTPSSWFSGMELFHKGHTDTGGYLGLKVITYDMTPHMEVTDLPPKTVNLPPIPAQ